MGDGKDELCSQNIVCRLTQIYEEFIYCALVPKAWKLNNQFLLVIWMLIMKTTVTIYKSFCDYISF